MTNRRWNIIENLNLHRITLLSILFLASILFCQDRDILYFQDGEEITGKLISIEDGKIQFEYNDSLHMYTQDQLLSIDIQSIRDGSTWKTINDIDDTLLVNIIENIPDLSEYEDNGYITLFEYTKITLDESDTTCYMDFRTIGLVLDDRAKSKGRRKFEYLDSIQDFEIVHARVINDMGELYHLDNAALEYGAPNGDTKFYDRIRNVKFALGEVNPGSIIDFRYKKNLGKISLENQISGKVVFADYEPVLKKIVDIEFPIMMRNLVNVSWKNFEGYKIENSDVFEMIITPENSTIHPIVRFQTTNIPALINRSFSPKPHMLSPSVAYNFSYNSPMFKKQFKKLLEDNNNEHIAQQMLDKIDLSHSSTLTDSLKKIYYFVVNEIPYKGPSWKDYSYVPHSLQEIYDEGYGNDLDHTYVLYCLLTHIGLKPIFDFAYNNASYITRNFDGYYNLDRPVLILIDQKLLLSPTNRFAKFGAIPGKYSDYIENHVSIIKDTTQIEEKSHFDISIDSKGNAEIVKTYSPGFFEEEKYRLLAQKNEDELKQYFEEYVNEICPFSDLLDFSIKNIADLDKELLVETRFYVKNFAQISDNLMLFKLPGLNYSSSGVGEKKRVVPFYVNETQKNSNSFNITFNSEYAIKSLPRSFDCTPGYISYKCQYSSEGNTLTFTDSFEVKNWFHSRHDWHEFRETILMRTSVKNNWIILEKN